MRRRDFISFLGSVATAWPLTTHAQQPMIPVIGYFSGRSPDAEAPIRVPFLKALEESGFAVGRNIAIEYRFSQGQDDRLPELAAELVRKEVALLVATDRSSALAAKAATATIPIVFTIGFDPVQLGLVASFNKPGGNATGVSIFTTELGPKRLGLLRELLPKLGTIAFVVNPNSDSTPFQIQEMETAAQAVGQPVLVVIAAVVYGATPFFQVIRQRLVVLAARYRIPAIYEWREFVTAGGLMSYNTDRNEFGREAGNYVGRILKGEKPAELPVVQSSRFELVINLKTAKALGLEMTGNLLARADEVIE